jgi:hypothetical protein
MVVQSISEIYVAWRAEGRTFRPQDVTEEWQRQGREVVRLREDRILANPDANPADLVEQIRDHRGDGNYTTQG